MDFLGSILGLLILVYFAIGLVLGKIIERKNGVSFTTGVYIVCMFTWLPYIIWGMLDGLKGKPRP
jgi:uncharacterized membrane protein YecN with MAPEG domain